MAVQFFKTANCNQKALIWSTTTEKTIFTLLNSVDAFDAALENIVELIQQDFRKTMHI